MSAVDRRTEITEMLFNESRAITGTELANKFEVTRQVIVKDIAILKAAGINIISTASGYVIHDSLDNRIKKMIAVNHSEEEMHEELEIVVKYGGIVEDVIIEHPLYGELRAALMIKNLNDLNKFKNSFNGIEAKPLSVLTNGVHLHTISADSKENMDLITNELKEKGFIL